MTESRLHKLLDTSSSIPNVTFICAFSEADLQRQLDSGGSLSPGYLEKFFPVSVSVAPADPILVGRCFRAELQRRLEKQGWFATKQEGEQFETLLRHAWDDALANVCTNLRKTGLLINDLIAAAEPIIREVNLVDLVLIETIRRFAPTVYSLVKTNAGFLTDARADPFLDKEKSSAEFFAQLNREMGASAIPNPLSFILCWLFPEYGKNGSNPRARIIVTSRRRAEPGAADAERRIEEHEYFEIYFRAAVPELMFRQVELDRLLARFATAVTENETERIFSELLNCAPPGSPKRTDALWKLSRGAEKSLAPAATERLAYVAAKHAEDYVYDLATFGEARYAVNMVFIAAQKLAASCPQRVLEGAMAQASEDAFARKLLTLVETPDHNKILTDVSHVDIKRLEISFIERMRKRYRSGASGEDFALAEWWSFRRWVEFSPTDRLAEQSFWRSFIGTSRKRLAQAANFIYPGNVYWQQDPTPAIDVLFPLAGFGSLLGSLSSDDAEAEALERLQDLLDGKPRIGQHVSAVTQS